MGNSSDKRSDLFLKFLVVITFGLAIYIGIKSLIEKYDTIEPFAIEHYTITEDGMFNIYFNRDILKDEEIELKVWLENNQSKGKYGNIHINEDTNGQIFTYDSNKKDNLNRSFNKLIQNHTEKKDTIRAASFNLAQGNGIETTFIEEKLCFIREQFKNFKPTDRGQIEEVNRNDYTSNCEMWLRSRLQFSEGKFNSHGKKQGKWIWYFSNGSVLAEATFKDDVISDSLSVYKFNEKITP